MLLGELLSNNMRVIPFEENHSFGHAYEDRLKGYIYENVFDEKFYQILKKHVISIFNKSSTDTFLTHGTTLHLDGQRKHLISSKKSNRKQHVLYDLSYLKEYYFQTPDTIREWSVNQISYLSSPVFLKYLKRFESVEPIANEVDNWITFRIHLNVLRYNECLSMHTDGGIAVLKNSNSRLLSLTFYLDDHVDSFGGELWSINGFVYKPKQNSALMLMNGNRVIHGVSANMNPNKKVRLAFTARIAHKDDLILPGHPSKFLYKPEYLDDL